METHLRGRPAKHPTLEKTLFDRSGRFWIASRRTVAPLIAGLACLDYKGTIDNAKDDVVTFRSSAYNQDGTSCDLSQGVYAIAEDRDGALWIGAATGVYVISDPDEWADTNFRITQVKVPRNDGTNYADYLLEGVAVNDICVDGANRKWMATLSNGVYLVSADGTEIIHHSSPATLRCFQTLSTVWPLIPPRAKCSSAPTPASAPSRAMPRSLLRRSAKRGEGLPQSRAPRI